ncbi:hypothetical protein GCM10027160_52530 [Streptomyces calidiresistens]
MVARADFKEQDAAVGQTRRTGGQHCAARPGTDHDVVVVGLPSCGHSHPLAIGLITGRSPAMPKVTDMQNFSLSQLGQRKVQGGQITRRGDTGMDDAGIRPPTAPWAPRIAKIKTA